MKKEERKKKREGGRQDDYFAVNQKILKLPDNSGWNRVISKRPSS